MCSFVASTRKWFDIMYDDEYERMNDEDECDYIDQERSHILDVNM